MKLEGEVAIVTGGPRGIGRGIAHALAREGASVVIADINLDGAAKVAAELSAQGHTTLAIKSDVSDESQVNQLAEGTAQEFGRIDILVNNATGTDLRLFRFFHETQGSDWDHEIAVTFKGVLYCSKAVIPWMIKQGSGRIINITSVAVLTGLPKRAIYSACKGAVAAFSRSLAAELASHQILVNCIACGPIRSEAKQEGEKSISHGTKWEHIIPLGRIGEPEDIASMVVLLASDEGRFITGQQYSIDGGASTLESRLGRHWS